MNLAHFARQFQDATHPSLPFMTPCHRRALEYLRQAFEMHCPVAVVTGESSSGRAFLVRRFETDLAARVVVSRVERPTTEPAAFLQAVLGGFGFDECDCPLDDLENFLKLFLTHQKSCNREAVLVIEEAQAHGPRVFAEVHKLLQSRIGSGPALLVVLTGGPQLNGVLNSPGMADLADIIGDRFCLEPFSIDETREYISDRLTRAGCPDLESVFSADALATIHDLSDGIPGAINSLCGQCLQMAELSAVAPIEPALVTRCSELLRQSPAEALMTVETPESPTDTVARVIVSVNGEVISTVALDRQRTLIGRNQYNDICIDSRYASRHHALLINTAGGAFVVDLKSTNGTFVNGERIDFRALADQDVVGVGNCRIKFRRDGADADWAFDQEREKFSDTAKLRSAGHLTGPAPASLTEVVQ